ncbi:MAG: 4-hydroxy-3-methylbut-2-enyl diphosphate reductase [Planctomycetota bacterium]
MRVVLPNPRGFCAGVRMAIDVVDQVIDLYPDRRIYVYHEIVHNRHVVERFERRGVVFVERIADIPEGSVVVFSAHGISPAVRNEADERGLLSIDATCPLVTKVHSEAIRYAKRGFQILLIGHRDHQEVLGTAGEAPEATIVVETPEQVASLEVSDPSKLVYLTQTTLSTDDAAVIIRAIKQRFPGVHEPPGSDICYATTNRQHAVRSLAPEVDVVLVVGSQNSSNSVRLTEIAANAGTPGYRIDDASELDDSWLPRGGSSTVLVTAGASAPEDLVAGVCRALLERFGGSLEQWDIVEEHVEFALPGALRRELKSRGIDGESRRIVVETPVPTEELYGSVALTISAPSSPPDPMAAESA